MQPLRVAVIGAGSIARRAHLPGYVKAGARVTALSSPTAPDLEEVAAQYGARPYRNWQAMLAEGGFEAVSICTPPALHCEMAVACARQGLHVLVEKPMAVSLEECDRMIAAAEQNGTRLMVFHNERCAAHHRCARELLASGNLGKPYLVHGIIGHGGPEDWSPKSAWFFDPHQAGRGVLADLAYHMIDLMHWLLDQEVVEVGAFTATFEKNSPLEDTASIALRFKDGVMGTLQASWVLHTGWENALTIHCQNGRLSIPTETADAVRMLQVTPDGKIVETSQTNPTEDDAGWFAAVNAFVQAVVNNQPSPIPGTEGRAAMSAVLAAHQSSLEKRFVKPA